VLSYTISCSAGWNLVASPLFPGGFPAGSIATSPDGILMTPLYFFDGEFYSVATQLHPGEGYWAFLTEDGSFVIDRSYAGFERNYSSDGCEVMTNPPAPPSAEMVSVPRN